MSREPLGRDSIEVHMRVVHISLLLLTLLAVQGCSRTSDSDQSQSAREHDQQPAADSLARDFHLVDTVFTFSDGMSVRLVFDADSQAADMQKYWTYYFTVSSSPSHEDLLLESMEPAESRYELWLKQDSISIVERGRLPLGSQAAEEFISICEYVVTSKDRKVEWSYVKRLAPQSRMTPSEVGHILIEYGKALDSVALVSQDANPGNSKRRDRLRLGLYGHMGSLYAAALSGDSTARSTFEDFPNKARLDGCFGEEYTIYRYYYDRVYLIK